MGELSEINFCCGLLSRINGRLRCPDSCTFIILVFALALSASHIALHSLCNFFSMVLLSLMEIVLNSENTSYIYGKLWGHTYSATYAPLMMHYSCGPYYTPSHIKMVWNLILEGVVSASISIHLTNRVIRI